MDVNHVNPVLEAFSNILPQLGLNNIEKNGISVKGKYIKSRGVVIIIGIIGDVKGNIIYGMSVDTAMKIASIMMMGMPVEKFDELPQSAISELVNMLTANVAMNFSKDNIEVDISTPTLIEGEFTASSNSDKVLCVEMSVDGMLIEVNISLEKNRI
ncbi:chemotaxis protein CheX [Clostridium vincentii]|uniref:CheY-P phosphatase CheX n=1 Tax=Clostridium vincentii TaxID=52704 RepID=A0A2T0BE32_9CLOT|nr:chemotaxis protein CheX [Clostridium vincentii]PRR82150.1 CheY-P phosphatase CheX [Clostridium vincentii]